MKKKTLSIIFALFISCTLFVACGKEEIVEVVAPIESVETVEPIETITEEIEISVEESTETVAEIESVVAETVSEEETSSEEVATSTIEIVEELDKTMYGIKNGNIRNGDSTDYDIVASLEYGATIHVTGKTANGWYRIQWGDTEAYCASSLLTDSLPSDSGNTSEIPQQPTQPEQPTQPSTPPSSGGGNNNGGVDNTTGGYGIPGSGTDWGNSDLFG